MKKVMMHDRPIGEILQRAYLEYFNDFLSMAAFAEHRGISEDDAVKLVAAGKLAHETIVQRSKDTRYNVRYESMGHPDMHNYSCYFEGERIGYAFTDDSGWAMCDTHHTMMIAGLLD